MLPLLSGCKTSRKLTVGAVNETKETSEFFYSIQKQAFHYQTFSARMHAELIFSDKDLSSRVDMKMIKDSVFQLSVLPLLGMEIFRIEFNTDSVKIIDRINKCYIIESYAELKKNTSVEFNFYNLQALFTNHIFVPGEQDITPRQYHRFTLKQEGNITEAQVKDAMELLLYTFKADNLEKLLATRITAPSERYIMQWTYTDFRPTEEQLFPMQIDVQILNDGIPAAGIKLSFSRIRRDIPLQMDFPIPEKYKRTTFEEIIKVVS
ncbi:MAG: DUF4292 domain-containing protein [Tannerellaceae bacterium]|nr:DUF4292 domain-containing protein [Tannerellaceae bacterium]